MQVIDGPLAVIRSVSAIAGLRILDIGCGGGGLARQLSAAGANVSGIDPDVEAIRSAVDTVPEAKFAIGSAEELPFESACFDLVLIVNSLYHVPQAAMLPALREVMRVLTSDGLLIVIEPLATGNFFDALRLVDDETIVRAAAQTAMDSAVAGSEIMRLKTLTYTRSETFDTPDQFLARIAAVDPSRLDVIGQNYSGIATEVESAAKRGPHGKLIFDQPIKADIFQRPLGIQVTTDMPLVSGK
jgi:SAM-dependent methyltransferase